MLTPVKEADAELGGQAARAPIRRRSSVSLPSRTGDEGFLVAEKAAAAAAADDDYDPDSCSFQFAAAVYYVEAHDGICEVDVMRIGSTLKPAWVDFACESGAALGGSQFELATGCISFAVGEYLKAVSVRINPSKVWQPPLDFSMRLENPSSGSTLNKTSQLDRCRVWILHTGNYPTSSIDAESSRSDLLREFCVKCMANETVRVGTLKTLVVDQLQNLLYLWQLFISVYFVDHVLDATMGERRPLNVYTGDWSRIELAMGLAMAHILPFFPVLYWQERKCWFGVGGAARKTLQVDILRKYLQLTDASRKRVGEAGLVEALYRDAVEVVDHGFMQLLAGACAAGKIVIILCFTAFHTPAGVPLQLILPVFILARMAMQETVATSLRLKYFKAQNRMLSHADDVTKNFRLIRDYQVIAMNFVERCYPCPPPPAANTPPPGFHLAAPSHHVEAHGAPRRRRQLLFKRRTFPHHPLQARRAARLHLHCRRANVYLAGNDERGCAVTRTERPSFDSRTVQGLRSVDRGRVLHFLGCLPRHPHLHSADGARGGSAAYCAASDSAFDFGSAKDLCAHEHADRHCGAHACKQEGAGAWTRGG